ncbi:MAG: CBS domain-containing protein [Rhodocyclales bacterium]|nr:CBS domain-containing protein [Rhodocyclales bacterium]
MFGIYGVNGQIFSGRLEQLPDVRQVGRRRAVDAIGTAGAELGDSAARVLPERLRAASAAYRRMLQIEEERGPLVHARQIMRPQVITLAAADEVARAWSLLVDRRIRQAPVLGRDGSLVGIVSEHDLLVALNADRNAPSDIMARHVADVMTSPVVAADPLTDVRRIAQVMLERGVDGVPIVDERHALVGFVSRGDLLRALVADPPLSLWR